MSIVDKITDAIASQSSLLSPLTLSVPSASIPVLQVSRFIHHLTTTPVHPVYAPYLRFGVIHAIRVTTVWAGLTKTRKSGNVGRCQDLFGYLTIAWGGSTVVSLLLGQPPSWLLSPTPWIIYCSIYLLLVPTGLSRYFITTAPTFLFNLITAYIDGLTRGTTISAIPSMISSSSISLASTWWTPIVLSALATASGGAIVQLLGLHLDQWTLNTPAVLQAGVLGTMDAWGPALAGVVYAALQGHYQEFAPVSERLATVLPDDVKIGSTEKALVDPAHARAISVLVLGTLLATRVIIQATTSRNVPKKLAAKKAQVTKKTELVISEKGESKEKVVKTPTKVRAESGSKATPRKSPRAKSK